MQWKKTWGIVATQDCDAIRAPGISFFVISPITDVLGQRDIPKDDKGWVTWITKHNQERGKFFYLPPDAKLGFTERMLVIFEKIIQLPKDPITRRVPSLRKGRLNDDADEHFRESAAQFFRRYPFNPWYPLSPEEFGSYVAKNPEAKAYPWQKESGAEKETRPDEK